MRQQVGPRDKAAVATAVASVPACGCSEWVHGPCVARPACFVTPASPPDLPHAASKMLARRGRLRRTGSPPAAAPGDAPLGDAAMRADDMLRGELLSTLMQRRVMMAEQQQQGPAALQAAAAPEPAAPQMSAELAGGVPLPESAAAAAVAAASAATDVPAQPRGRGRPRKHSPEAAAPAAPGSAPAVAGAADGAVAAGGCGAAAALAAYEDALARATLASVSFCLKAQLEYGQRVRVVGGIQELGERVVSSPVERWL